MSTTDQRIAETEADPADAAGWTVPGLHPRETESVDYTVPVNVLAELSSPARGSHPVIGAVGTCVQAMEAVREAPVGTLTAREIRVLLAAVVHLAAVVFGLRLRLLAAGETQRVHDLTGATGVAAFFAHLTRTRRDHATAQTRLAHDLEDRYPLLAAALSRGAISPDQVLEAVKALRRLPKDVPAEKVTACEEFLIEAAQTFSADQLRVIGKKLWHVIDPDGADRKEGEDLEDEERLAKAKAYLKAWRNGDGTTSFRGKLPDLHADILLKAIRAYAAPARRKNPNISTTQPDDHRHPQPGNGDGSSGVDAGDGSSGVDAGDGNQTTDESSAAGEPATGARDTTGSDGRSPGPEPDPRDPDSPPPPPDPERIGYDVRQGHGLIDLIEHLPEDVIPYAGGIPATIVVSMTLDQLQRGLGVATLDTGTEISAAQGRHLACAAGLIPMVLNGKSEPLDVGQEQRFHTKSQRIAAGTLDKVCAIIGCHVPAAQCHLHHPQPFSEGGATSFANGLPVCPYHHSLVHSIRWKITWHGRKGTLRRVSVTR